MCKFLLDNANKDNHSEKHDKSFSIGNDLVMRIQAQCGFKNVYISACLKIDKKVDTNVIFDHTVKIEILKGNEILKVETIEYKPEEYWDRKLPTGTSQIVLRKNVHMTPSENNFLKLCRSNEISIRCSVYLK